jgi:transcriptional regulator with XRE-family HTH domain
MNDTKCQVSDTNSFSARKADLVDKHVGQRIRERRRNLDVSQQEIGEILGISYQQLQKYESGQNRISAGRLFMLSHILKVDVGFFYQGLPPTEELFKGKLGDLDYIMPEIQALPPSSLRQALADLVTAIRESEKGP